jgi:hypothetical protein
VPGFSLPGAELERRAASPGPVPSGERSLLACGLKLISQAGKRSEDDGLRTKGAMSEFAAPVILLVSVVSFVSVVRC